MMTIPLSWLLGPWGWAPSWSSVTQKSFIDKLPIRDTFSLSVKRDEWTDGWRCHRLILPLVGGIQSFCLQSIQSEPHWDLWAISPEKILYTICYYFISVKTLLCFLLPCLLWVVEPLSLHPSTPGRRPLSQHFLLQEYIGNPQGRT